MKRASLITLFSLVSLGALEFDQCDGLSVTAAGSRLIGQIRSLQYRKGCQTSDHRTSV